MKLGHSPLVIGNWKMNPITESSAKRLAQELKKTLARTHGVEVVVAPPSVFIGTVCGVKGGKNGFALGAQNVHHEKLGSYTGEVSHPMFQSFGVSHVILGHSERRKDGESDVTIQKKLEAVVKAGMIAVLCVGEVTRDHGAHYFNSIEAQVREGLKGLGRAKLGNVVIAYEPVWAIGTGNTATSHDVHEMKLFIEKTLADLYGRAYAHKVRILYGGSVNAKNAEELMRDGTVSGFLVGGSSLDAKEFTGIVNAVKKVCEA